MAKSNKKNKYKNGDEKVAGKKLAASIAVLLFGVYALLILSIAWFSGSSLVTANSQFIKTIGLSSNEYKIYQWVGEDKDNGNWVLTSNGINYTDAMPNENRRYLIVSDGDFNTVLFDFNQQNELFDFVHIAKISENSNGVTYDESKSTVKYDYGGDTPNYFSYNDKSDDNKLSSNKYKLQSTKPCKAMVFDIYVSKDACNHFSNIGFNGKIKVK